MSRWASSLAIVSSLLRTAALRWRVLIIHFDHDFHSNVFADELLKLLIMPINVVHSGIDELMLRYNAEPGLQQRHRRILVVYLLPDPRYVAFALATSHVCRRLLRYFDFKQ